MSIYNKNNPQELSDRALEHVMRDLLTSAWAPPIRQSKTPKVQPIQVNDETELQSVSANHSMQPGSPAKLKSVV